MSSDAIEVSTGPLRLWTSVKGDLAEAFRRLRADTGMEEPELLRQGLIRLINEVAQNGGDLVIAKLVRS